MNGDSISAPSSGDEAAPLRVIPPHDTGGRHRPLAVWVLLGTLVLVAVGLSAVRSIWRYDAPEVAEFNRARQGQFDFHNGIYFPARAFLDGVSPYGQRFADEYPVTRPLPLMSPWLLVLNAPLALLPVHASEVFYFAINCALLLLIAWFSVQWLSDRQRRTTWFFLVALLIVASRAGHTTLFTGYLTAWMVAGSLTALHFAAGRPWLSALGVTIASCKPTYAIPLFLLMIARGDRVAALRGLALSIVGAGLALGRLLLVNTPAQLWADLQHGQSQHMADAYELPVNTWTRIDLLAVVAKWTEMSPSELTHLIVMIPLLALPALSLWRLQFVKDARQAAGISSGLMAVSMLCTLYHHVYDALLVFPAACGLFLAEPSMQRGSRMIRWVLAGLLLLVAWNYPSSELALKGVEMSALQHRLITSTGPVALAAAWIGLCALPWLPREPKQVV